MKLHPKAYTWPIDEVGCCAEGGVSVCGARLCVFNKGITTVDQLLTGILAHALEAHHINLLRWDE